MYIQVRTSNALPTNDGGFHELHDVRYLSSPMHAVATLERIIGLNLVYACKDAKLKEVDVTTGQWDIAQAIEEWKNTFYELNGEIKIHVYCEA